MNTVRQLFSDLNKVPQNLNLISVWYRSERIAPVAQIEITFTDKVAITARDNLAHYIKRKYSVQTWWVNADTLHVQDHQRYKNSVSKAPVKAIT